MKPPTNAALFLQQLEKRPALPPNPPGLIALLNHLGRPDRRYPILHIAGTNGKGSVAAILHEALSQAGYKTGLFTSPHIYRFHERIRVARREITDEAFLHCIKRILEAEEALEAPLNYFSFLTLAALLHFQQEGCDAVVLEAGLGGRLDPTNVIEAPCLTILTRIGLDHMAQLGDTIAAIAREKAGIIRKGGDVVTIRQAPEAAAVIKSISEQQEAHLHLADIPPYTLHEGRIWFRGMEKPLGLPGSYQAENAAIAIKALQLLQQKGWCIPQSAIEMGLCNASWPARFELFTPWLLFDGAHNPSGGKALAESLRSAFPNRPLVFLLAFMGDKDYEAFLKALSPANHGMAHAMNHAMDHAMVATTLSHPRGLPADTLANCMERYCGRVYRTNSIAEGLNTAKKILPPNGLIVAAGSLYMAEALREAMAEYSK